MPLSPHVELIRLYYDEFWNHWNFDLASTLLSADIQFRGSLGVDVNGIPGFLDYMRLVREAFPDFHNRIEDTIAEGNKAAARLFYTGTHRGAVFGIPPTGRAIAYQGSALFTFRDAKIREGWVLGDALGLLRQLEGAFTQTSETCNGLRLKISPATREECSWAAGLMAASEPWLTLGRDLAACRRVFDDRTVLPFVARFEGQLCAFLVLRRRGLADTPYIKSMAVNAECRSHGIGSRLLAFAEELYRKEACTIFVCCSSFNPRALAFYERHGYRAAGEFRDYLIPGHSEILLAKRIDP